MGDFKARDATSVDIYAGMQLRAARINRGLTLRGLSAKLGVTFQQIQKYENATNRISLSRLSDICKALSVSPNYFFE